jgi:hypothetical protein
MNAKVVPDMYKPTTSNSSAFIFRQQVNLENNPTKADARYCSEYAEMIVG